MTAEGLAIEVRDARKVYKARVGGPRTVVEDISISVPYGGIHGLLGPNGAGKTTTIKMLLGLVRPTGGTFRIAGVDSRTPAGRARLGFLPEQPYFPTQLTAAEALRLYGRLVGLSRKELTSETERLLELVGLEGRTHDVLSKFSRGMLQRLGVAQALLGDPAVVVLDEPVSGLDPVGQRDIRNLMLALKDEGRTILLSSHQLSEVEAVCDRVTIVNRGRVAAEGRIDDLLSVAGRTLVRVRELPARLPEALSALVRERTDTHDGVVLCIPDSAVREAVDLIDDAGGVVVSVNPERESLEEYFTRMLDATKPARPSAEEVA